MKKSLIVLLTVVMAITFGCLLYFQVMYLENMVKMRENQFSEGVMRSLHATAGFLERQEALHFLEEDVTLLESGMLDDFNDANLSSGNHSSNLSYSNSKINSGFPSPTQNVGERYRSLQTAIRNQYLYQKGLLNEVVLTILAESGGRPMLEKADSSMVRQYLTQELAANGIDLPFEFAVTDEGNNIVYSTEEFNDSNPKDTYSDILFPNSNIQYHLVVDFPSKHSHIFSSVRFIIPTLALTVILILVFVYTIILVFRQKKLSVMKTDFINNMTHELKTPTSSISLAAQMLGDDSVKKSPQMLKHLSKVITDESKRLLFQIDKVLQLSVFDNTEAAIKFSEVNANDVIEGVVNNFKLRVEKEGGEIILNLDALNSDIYVDPMQFTNMINNLLENGVKYRKEDIAPVLEITTANKDNKHLEIKVRDNGIGIKKESQKHIFEKFYRVSTGNRHDVKGFGLGLAYVKKMVTMFSGSISVDSKFGQWTEFTIILPLSNLTGKNKF